MSYTKEDIIRMVEEGDVEFIRMQFTDIFGRLKNVAITSSQIKKAVNNEIMIDGSSIEGFVRINESDMYLHPDLDSYAVLPWRPSQARVARLICDVYNPDGTPFAGDPRSTLKKELVKAAEKGYSFNVGPECEFFLFETDENGQPTTKTSDDAGYFDLDPLDHGGSTRREICLMLEKMGYEVEASNCRQCHDIQTCSQDNRPEERSACDIHAQADLRNQRQRHAHQHVTVQGRRQHLRRSQ